MLDEIDFYLGYADKLSVANRSNGSLMLTKNKLEYFKSCVINSFGSLLVSKHEAELISHDWDTETLYGKFSLITKKSLAQRLEFGDEITKISKDFIVVRKSTDKEWVFLNDKSLFKRN